MKQPDSETDRETDRQRNRQRNSQTVKQPDRETDRETDRQRNRKTQRTIKRPLQMTDNRVSSQSIYTETQEGKKGVGGISNCLTSGFELVYIYGNIGGGKKGWGISNNLTLDFELAFIHGNREEKTRREDCHILHTKSDTYPSKTFSNILTSVSVCSQRSSQCKQSQSTGAECPCISQ